MTKSERYIRERGWLKTRSFCVTRSLLAKAADLPESEREGLCYIQNKVLLEGKANPDRFTNISSKTFKDRLGRGYKRFVDTLVAFGELEVNDRYLANSGSGFSKSYRVPLDARKSGLVRVDFRKRATPPKDNSDLTDPVIRYAHHCISMLEVPLTLPSFGDPLTEVAVKEQGYRPLAHGALNVRYGPNARRLFQPVITMPRVGRRHLRLKDSTEQLFDYDIRSCHPVLLLPRFSDGFERVEFEEMLRCGLYEVIRATTMPRTPRDEVKGLLMATLNEQDRKKASKWKVFRFFQRFFPAFTKEVLKQETGLAASLQRAEAEIMVDSLGQFCSENGLFWVPCHDGWLGMEDSEEKIVAEVLRRFQEKTSFWVTITKKGLRNGNTVDMFSGSYSYSSSPSYYSYVSHVGGEHTFDLLKVKPEHWNIPAPLAGEHPFFEIEYGCPESAARALTGWRAELKAWLDRYPDPVQREATFLRQQARRKR